MNQQEFWNKKFLRDAYLYGKKPNEFIYSCSANFNKTQRLLCVGEGEGRNAVFLAKKGFEVVALDASDIGLKKLEEYAKEENVKVKTLCTDINDWIPKKKYGTIVASYFHVSNDEKKDVFKKLESALKNKGFLVLEVFSKNQINYSSGGPKDTDLLYSIEEFENIFKDSIIHKLEEVIINLDEGKGHQGKASVIRLVIQKN